MSIMNIALIVIIPFQPQPYYVLDEFAPDERNVCEYSIEVIKETQEVKSDWELKCVRKGDLEDWSF